MSITAKIETIWGIIQKILCVIIFIMFVIYMRHGVGGNRFPDRTNNATRAGSELTLVASLPLPPGNVAVSSSGKVFFSFHPEAEPSIKVAQIGDVTFTRGEGSKDEQTFTSYKAFPNAEYQDIFKSVLSLRIATDSEGRELLWVLDYAMHGWYTPSLYAFDVDSGDLVDQHQFDKSVAPIGSMLNDFQVDTKRNLIYIADSAILSKNPAIVVYDIEKKSARRLLDSAPQLLADDYNIYIDNLKHEMVLFGVFAIRPSIDSIVLDMRGEYLYFAPVTENDLYRISVDVLIDQEASTQDLQKAIEVVGEKTMSDGLTIDEKDNIFISDMEHSAIVLLNPNKSDHLVTLFKDEEQLRWPDGFSFGPNQEVYVTCSALQHIIFQSHETIQHNAPYHIFKFTHQHQGRVGQ